MAKQKKFDSVVLGIIIGVLLPLSIFTIVYFTSYAGDSTYAYLGFSLFLSAAAPKTMSLCAIASLAPFYLFLQTDRMKSTKGIVIGTSIIAVLVILVFLLF